MKSFAFEHRYSDHSLDEDQQSFQDGVAKMLAANWSPAKVRATSGGTIDQQLFRAISQMELLSMAAIPADDGAAGLVDLVIAAEVAGAALVNFPLAEVWTCVRLFARLGLSNQTDLEDIAQLPVMAFAPLESRQMIPWGAETRTIIGMMGSDLVKLRLRAPLALKSSHCGLGFGSWSSNAAFDKEVLLSGAKASDEWELAMDEWRIVTAALAAGAGNTAVSEAVEFAKNRETRGVAIGSLQAISHPLADAHIGLTVTRNLARKAAWFSDNEPSTGRDLGRLAFVQASRAASQAAHVGVHVHGGQGVSSDAHVTLAFTRARQWTLVAGDPERLLLELGRALGTSQRLKDAA
jgi:alkylation response protein AidB-like acyl-CoA dehydrogenase